MASSSVPKVVAVVAVLSLLVAATLHVVAAITCEEVTELLTPCISYAVFGGDVSPKCCEGVKALNVAQNTTEARRAACSCIKERAAMIPGLSYDRVALIPGKCGTTCPYTINPSTNCSSVN